MECESMLFLACTVTQYKNNSKTIQWIKLRNCHVIGGKEGTSLRFESVYFPEPFRYSSKYFAQIYGAQYGAAMLVYLRGTPTWRCKHLE